jgi:hypothetical protein
MPAWINIHAGLSFKWNEMREQRIMKTASRVSFILNVVLAGCMVYLWMNRHQEVNLPQRAPIIPGSIPAQAAGSPAPITAQEREPRTLQWGQLESDSDYRVYIKNLRGIGCPEQTLRDIVTGNVDRAFTAKRNELNLDGSEPGPWSESAEIRFINELLDGSGGEEASGTSAGGQSQSQEPYPLAFQKVDLDALGLNDDQKQVISRIQQQFIDEVGGPYQDPDDPAYQERWQKALPESDDMLKAMLGNSIFENYQLAAANPPSSH